MTLTVREVFPTLQGEGSLSGSPAVFVRFAGCNLWDGTKEGRARGRGACALWCDTHFVGGFKVEPGELHDLIDRMAASVSMRDPLIVLTGGEPGLQLVTQSGRDFIATKRHRLAIETNGTVELPEGIDHITVSPKVYAGRLGLDHVLQRTGTDLKVVVPSAVTDDDIEHLRVGFQHLYLQPLDIGDLGRSSLAVARQAAERLGGRVSLQTHKLIGVP